MSGSERICRALLCLAAVCCLTACAAEEVPAEAVLQPQLKTSEKVTYETVSVERGDYIKTAQGSTSMVYLLQEDLCWDKGETYYVETLVKKGDRVKAGDVLMQFEFKGSNTQLQMLKLQAQRLYEDSESGKQSRLQILEERKQQCGDLMSYDLQLAELEIEVLQAEYEAYVFQMNLQQSNLWKQIREMEEDQNDNVLVAPFDGVIKSVSRFNEGDLVFPGQFLVSMYATDRLLLSAKDGNGNLRYHMPVTIETGNAKNPTYLTGRVVAAPNVVPSEVSQPLTLIELDENITENELTGSLKYHCTSQEILDILVVDGDLVQKENGASYVYVLEKDTMQKRYLAVGTENTDMIWILDGLAEGQTLVVN